MKKFVLAVIALVFCSLSPVLAQESGKNLKENKKMSSEAKLYATFDTSMGKIVCELFPREAPLTVKNFVELANGTKEWLDPKTGEKVKKPFYDGLIFHRIIDNFMIQGGCPNGIGNGGPGYKFNDEFSSGLKFDKPGRLAMANSGPNTNGSQFFITHVPTDWLNNKHTIFGQVVEGQDVVDAMGKVEMDARGKPVKPVVLKKVLVSEALPGKK